MNPNIRTATREDESAIQKTTESSVEVVKYLREVLSRADDSGIAIVETRLEERFSGGLDGTGAATHLRLEYPDGTGLLTCFERVSGMLDGRRGSFVLQASGRTDRSRVVRGQWEVIAGSATGELIGLRGHAAFVAYHDERSQTQWSARTALTYWFER